MLRAASWRFVRGVMVAHSNKSTWDVSKQKLVRICSNRTFRIKIPIILNVDQKPPIQTLSAANVVIPATALKNPPGKFKNSWTIRTRQLLQNVITGYKGGIQLQEMNGLTLNLKTLTTTTLDINFFQFWAFLYNKISLGSVYIHIFDQIWLISYDYCAIGEKNDTFKWMRIRWR